MDFIDAASAVYERAAELAKSADADELVKLADATAKVRYGPQGADYEHRSHRADDVHYHYDGAQREREAGFR
jgi:hypothetical protein